MLRPRWFFQNLSEDFLRDPVLSDELRLPAGDGREAFVDAEEIARTTGRGLRYVPELGAWDHDRDR